MKTISVVRAYLDGLMMLTQTIVEAEALEAYFRWANERGWSLVAMTTVPIDTFRPTVGTMVRMDLWTFVWEGEDPITRTADMTREG